MTSKLLRFAHCYNIVSGCTQTGSLTWETLKALCGSKIRISSSGFPLHIKTRLLKLEISRRGLINILLHDEPLWVIWVICRFVWCAVKKLNITPSLLHCNIREKSTDEQQNSDRKSLGIQVPRQFIPKPPSLSVKEKETKRLKYDKRIERKHKVELKQEAK